MKAGTRKKSTRWVVDQEPLDVVALESVVLSTHSLKEVLTELVAEAAGEHGVAPSCGLTLRGRDDRPLTFRASDGLVARLDEVQYSAGDGPCLQAMYSGELVETGDLVGETRWPAFVEHARAQGVRRVLSVPLRARASLIGALNVYQRNGGFSDEDRSRAVVFADRAAGAIALAARLAEHERRTAAAQDARGRSMKRLHDQATHDDLTGLHNRRGVHELLDEMLADGLHERVAVLFCDVDNFKRINESLGHDAGDELLVAVARRLVSGLPEACTAARMSGDEFVVLCSDVGEAGGLQALTTQVSESLDVTVPVRGQLIQISASVGAAVVTGRGTTSEDLLRFGDAALSEAKGIGPGSIAQAHPDLITTVNRQLHIEGRLRSAIRQGDLTLHYQPILDRHGALVMAEALLRWPYHSDRSMLTPEVILKIAKQGNLRRELDQYVLRTALAEAARWPVPGRRPVAIAVNLAGLLPDESSFTDDVARIITDSGIDWSRVVLEITETPLATLPAGAEQAMTELTGRGLRFAVDDFGIGYSSLARLKDIPAQIIKLDRRFVVGMESDSRDRAITAAVVDIAHGLGSECVAEGVETSAQLSMLDDFGIDAYQGWLLSKALPAAEFRALLGRSPLTMPRGP